MCEAVLRFDHLVKCAGVSDGQTIVQKELHAARRCSNSTASRIASSATSYQRATSVTDPVAFMAFAKMSVGMPLASMIGRPKFRVGSRTTNRLSPRGHQRTNP